jgi:hypothetical protein
MKFFLPLAPLALLAACQVSVDNQSKANLDNMGDSLGNVADAAGNVIDAAADKVENAADDVGNVHVNVDLHGGNEAAANASANRQ